MTDLTSADSETNLKRQDITKMKQSTGAQRNKDDYHQSSIRLLLHLIPPMIF